MLLCPSSISPAQRRLPRKAYISAPLPSAPRRGGSPEKHASLPLFHQHRAAEAPQKSMLLCPSSISTAQRRLPRKACFYAPLPSAPRRGGSPEKHAPLPLFHQHRAEEAPQKSIFSAPLPSAPRREGSPEKHASLPLFHQNRAEEGPQKSMLLCPSSISTAQRRLPIKACFSAPLPSAPRRGGSPEKHTSLPLFHQHRAEEGPQKSMLLCPSSISTAQRRLPIKACFYAPLPSAPCRGGSPEKHASLPLFHQNRAEEAPQKSIHLCPSSIRTAQRRLPRKACFSAPLPSAPSRRGGSPEKHAPLPLFHQHRAEEAPQKSMLLCPSTISTAQRRLPRKACFSAPLPSAPRRGGSPEKHTPLPLFHQHRAEEAPHKSMLLCPSWTISTAQRRLPRKACSSAPLPSTPRRGGSPEKHAPLPLFHQHRAEEAPQKSMLLCPSSINTAQRRLPRKAYISAPLPSEPRRGGSPEKHASLPLFHQHRRAEEAPQKSMLLCPSSISTAQRRLPRKACSSAPLPSAPRRGGSPEKHASLPLFHQHRAEEGPQKSILLCPSSISTAQRRLPIKACFYAPLGPSAPRSGGSPEKHAPLPLFHQHRAEEAPQKSMLLCPSSISTAQRGLPRKACFSAPLPSAPRRGGSQ